MASDEKILPGTPAPESHLRASEIIAKIRHQLEINVQIAEDQYPEGPIIDGKRVKGVAHSQDILAQHIRDHLNELEAEIAAPPETKLVGENEKLLEACRKAGVCMSCVLGAPDTYGCTDCLNTGWNGGCQPNSPEEIKSLFAGMIADFGRMKERAEGVKPVGLPQDVVALVIAARNALQYLYGLDGCELRALDHAVDAFSDRVPYEAGDA